MNELADQCRVRRTDVAARNDMRNQAVHGKLVLPWSDEEEDDKIAMLARLFHALTREAAAVARFD